MPRIYKPPRGKRKRSKKGTSNPPEPTKKELLEKAINTAPVSGLRYALQNLCEKVPGAASYAEIYMLVREKEVTKGKNQVSIAESEDEDDSTAEEEESSEDESDEEVNQRSRANKSDIGVGKMRLRLRWATCARCNEEFDVALNNRGDCVWHDGELRQNSDIGDPLLIPICRGKGNRFRRRYLE